MTTVQSINGDVSVGGQITANGLNLRTASIRSDDVVAAANISADKLTHRYQAGTNFDLAIGATVAAREEIVFIASDTCTISSFSAKLNGSATTGTTSFDLKKNGTTVLTGTVDITSAETTTVQTGTLSGTVTLAADDVVSIQLSNSSGDGTGPYAWAEIDENGS